MNDQSVQNNEQGAAVVKAKTYKPFALYMLLLPFMASSGFLAGKEIAQGEYNSQKMEKISKQVRVVKLKVDVPPAVVLTEAVVMPAQKADVVFEEVDIFANRAIGDEVTSLKSIVGKKTKYGLNKGQVLVQRDLE
ncbi:MAG: SAF domain-containing protein [Candidatus Obscuribacter phosphatis]|uniref:SAF domain-containing protein n=1 Tax=Candidatus Obscuribacter phosphatis TaxID=1906157 RepID=A0A8J7PLB7_9BACT|nr:SAF domain-containing protein [Candidatus Obscuribacter phosphatis]